MLYKSINIEIIRFQLGQNSQGSLLNASLYMTTDSNYISLVAVVVYLFVYNYKLCCVDLLIQARDIDGLSKM